MEQTWSDYGSANTAGGYPWTLAFDGSTTGNGTTSGDGTNIVWDITSRLASGDWVFYLDPGAIDPINAVLINGTAGGSAPGQLSQVLMFLGLVLYLLDITATSVTCSSITLDLIDGPADNSWNWCYMTAAPEDWNTGEGPDEAFNGSTDAPAASIMPTLLLLLRLPSTGSELKAGMQ